MTLGGYIRDIKVSGMLNLDESGGIHPIPSMLGKSLDHSAIFQLGHFSILDFGKFIIIFWYTYYLIG